MRAPSSRPLSRQRARRERGVALMIVIISITLLTVVATDFAFNTRVDLQLAANHRDDTRAYFLAKSGIGMARLVLKFQAQIDKSPIPGLPAAAQALLPPGQAGGGAAGINLQVWRMIKIDCHMLQGMVADPDPREQPPARVADTEFDREFSEVAERQQRRSFGGFEGCFQARISDEEERLNLVRLDAPQLSSQPVVLGLYELLSDKRFEFLFEREDANRVKVNPQEVLINLKDWIDEDEMQSSLNLSGQGDVFLRGFSDENYPYDSYQTRYEAKNARFDSVDELFMVHGVNDAFMAAFRDRLTVYPDVNARLNINTDDPMMLYAAIRSVADPARPDPRLADPVFVDRLIQQIRAAKMFAYFGMSVNDFITVVAAAGVPINSSIQNNVANNRWVSDKSTTYRIESFGEAGNVMKKITAVVRLDEGLGRLVYWREE
ncbi:MAG: type II secretion system protein GspK [Myxococcota bacterium]|nr:type II secretion system protein GspK [Myxococcota bacterium]